MIIKYTRCGFADGICYSSPFVVCIGKSGTSDVRQILADDAIHFGSYKDTTDAKSRFIKDI